MFTAVGKTRVFSNAVKDIVDSRNKRSVWTVSAQQTAEAHYATYPIALIEPCVLAGCAAGGTILDPFCGLATTGLAVLKHGREFLGIELSPLYVAISRKRLERHMPLLAQESEIIIPPRLTREKSGLVRECQRWKQPEMYYEHGTIVRLKYYQWRTVGRRSTIPGRFQKGTPVKIIFGPYSNPACYVVQTQDFMKSLTVYASELEPEPP